MTPGDRACGWCGHAARSHWEAAERDGGRRGCGLLGCPCPRLLDLRHRFGYFTRDELAEATGSSRHGALQPRAVANQACPGQFGPDGRWQACCGQDAG